MVRARLAATAATREPRHPASPRIATTWRHAAALPWPATARDRVEALGGVVVSSLSVVSAVRARRAATSLWARATLGRVLSLAGTAVSETQQRLTAVAAASGVRDARVVVLPTALMIAFGRARRGDDRVDPEARRRAAP